MTLKILFVALLAVAPISVAAQTPKPGSGALNTDAAVAACAEIGRTDLKRATRGLGNIAKKGDTDRLKRARLQLEKSESIELMLRCLMRQSGAAERR